MQTDLSPLDVIDIHERFDGLRILVQAADEAFYFVLRLADHVHQIPRRAFILSLLDRSSSIFYSSYDSTCQSFAYVWNRRARRVSEWGHCLRLVCCDE